MKKIIYSLLGGTLFTVLGIVSVGAVSIASGSDQGIEINNSNIHTYCDSDVVECNLANLGITSISSDTFSGFSNLQYLDLNNNQLSTLPTNAFQGLSNLEYLYLNENQLTTLPDNAFQGLSNLQYLDLNNNQLSTLPSNAFQGLSNLQYLDLNNNQLSTLPSNAFQGLSNLERLYLYDNQLSTLPTNAFQGLSNLQGIDLNNNQLTTLPTNAFQGLSNLQELYLNNNQLTTLPTSFFNLPNRGWQYIYIQNNCIDINALTLTQNQRNWLNNNVSYDTSHECKAQIAITSSLITPLNDIQPGSSLTYQINYQNNGAYGQGQFFVWLPTGFLTHSSLTPTETPEDIENITIYGLPVNSCYDSFVTNTSGPYADFFNAMARSMYEQLLENGDEEQIQNLPEGGFTDFGEFIKWQIAHSPDLGEGNPLANLSREGNNWGPALINTLNSGNTDLFNGLEAPIPNYSNFSLFMTMMITQAEIKNTQGEGSEDNNTNLPSAILDAINPCGINYTPYYFTTDNIPTGSGGTITITGKTDSKRNQFFASHITPYFIEAYRDDDGNYHYEKTELVYDNLLVNLINTIAPSSPKGSGGGGYSIPSTTKETIEDNKNPTIEEKNPTTVILPKDLSEEFKDAYNYAFAKGITTQKTYNSAALDRPITRAELAKMIVVYTESLEKIKVKNNSPHYSDLEGIPKNLQDYINLAYQYQLMGIDAYGNALTDFNPNGLVTRAEFGTVLSRILYGDIYNLNRTDYYSLHLQVLQAHKIISNTSPSLTELRGYIMLMLMRADKNNEEQ